MLVQAIVNLKIRPEVIRVPVNRFQAVLRRNIEEVKWRGWILALEHSLSVSCASSHFFQLLPPYFFCCCHVFYS